MKRFFQLFRKLYSNLILHLVVIWMLIIVTSVVLIGMFYAEDYLQKVLHEEVARSSIIIYIEPQEKTEDVMINILAFPVIENHRLVTSMQTITELQQTYGLSKLPQWVDPEKIPDFVHTNLNPLEFSSKNFYSMIDSLSSDDRIQQIDFNDVEVERLAKIMSLFNKFKWAPQSLVLILFCFVLFLIRRLMRARQKEKWKLWKSMNIKPIFKVSHLFLEFVLTIIVIGGIFVLFLFLFMGDLLILFNIDILQFNDGWRSVCVLLGIYMFISLINLLFKDREKTKMVFYRSGKV